MNAQVSAELYWLVMTVLMTALFWVPYIINRMLEQGVLRALWDPYGRTDTGRDWARRMKQAHENGVENLALFAPLVIAVQLTGSGSEGTATACMVYFVARLLHYVVFTFAVPLLRVVTFLTGFAVQIVLATAVLGIGT
jgi:uncharacterized MAPEG superfamily protein